MRESTPTLLAFLLLLASCASAEEGTSRARAPTRTQPLETVAADTADHPEALQASRGKNGVGKDHETQFSTPASVSRPAPLPPTRPTPPPTPRPPPLPPPHR